MRARWAIRCATLPESRSGGSGLACSRCRFGGVASESSGECCAGRNALGWVSVMSSDGRGRGRGDGGGGGIGLSSFSSIL